MPPLPFHRRRAHFWPHRRRGPFFFRSSFAWLRAFFILSAALAAALLLAGCLSVRPSIAAPDAPQAGCPSRPAATPPTASPTPTSTETAPETTDTKGVWLSYLELAGADYTSSTAFSDWAATVAANCAALGADTLIVQVRPFGDAFYPSELFPFSHLCTGTQGQSPGFDPLSLLISAAQKRGLAVQAWVNPYRLSNGSAPASFADTSPAVAHPDWVKTVDGALYLDPANPAVQTYIAQGLAELCRSYPLVGIQFDDYFYPTTDPTFDADGFAAYTDSGGRLSLADWRRQNVNALVSLCWQTVHQYPGVRFGISPQGNPDINRNLQYSDTALWLAQPGYVDFLCPQIYWGRRYQNEETGTRFALENIAAEWLALPRAAGVQLCFGLGAYRIGDGDGGGNASLAEWQSGAALADQAAALAALGANGVAFYRYGSLFGPPAPSSFAAQEVQNLSQTLPKLNFHL